MDIGKLTLDIMFPPRCPVCGDAVDLKNRIGLYTGAVPGSAFSLALSPYICPQCTDEFDYIKEPFCRKCGKQLFVRKSCDTEKKNMDNKSGSRKTGAGTGSDILDGSRLCHDCTEKERSFAACRCLMTYDELAREVLAGIKYHGRRESAVLLGILAAERFGEWIREISPDIIIPVPIHEERLKKRGYNQAEILAREIGNICGIPVVTDILRRSKNTAALKSLSIEDRLMAVQDAFETDREKLELFYRRRRMLHSPYQGMGNAGRGKVSATMTKKMHAESKIRMHEYSDANDISGRSVRTTVLLVDDIYTTGATLEGCTNALLKGGISEVYGICIAAGMDIIKS